VVEWCLVLSVDTGYGRASERLARGSLCSICSIFRPVGQWIAKFPNTTPGIFGLRINTTTNTNIRATQPPSCQPKSPSTSLVDTGRTQSTSLSSHPGFSPARHHQRLSPRSETSDNKNNSSPSRCNRLHVSRRPFVAITGGEAPLIDFWPPPPSRDTPELPEQVRLISRRELNSLALSSHLSTLYNHPHPPHVEPHIMAA